MSQLWKTDTLKYDDLHTYNITKSIYIYIKEVIKIIMNQLFFELILHVIFFRQLFLIVSFLDHYWNVTRT